MARTTGRLTALKVRRAQRPGMYADGGGLYLQVTEGGASWIYRYMLNKRAREMGLGPLALFGLSEARAKALDARRLRHEGIDPIETRKATRARERLDAAKSVTFEECAETYIKAHRMGWRNGKHAAQWAATLATYAGPVIGALPVQAVDTSLVLKVVEPIWTTKPETAGALRPYSIGPRCAAFAPGKILLAGAVTSTSCCRRAVRCAGSSTTLHCRMASCRVSWLRCASTKASWPARSNLRSSRPLEPGKL